MKGWHIFGFIVTAILLMGCSSLTIYRDFDHQVDFSQYQKYCWYDGEPVPGDQLARNPLVLKRVKATVDRILSEKGFQKVDSREQADLMVLVHAGVEEKIEIEDWGGREVYSPRWMPPDDARVTVDQYKEGTLIIDFVDLEREQLVWRGMGTKVLNNYRHPEKLQKTIDKTVFHILNKFPPGKN